MRQRVASKSLTRCCLSALIGGLSNGDEGPLISTKQIAMLDRWERQTLPRLAAANAGDVTTKEEESVSHYNPDYLD
jgi:hypothetical protein